MTRLRAGRRGHVRPGDRMVLADGMIADVSVVRPGTYWFSAAESGPGVAVHWHERGGTASGVIHRPLADTIFIVRDAGAAP